MTTPATPFNPAADIADVAVVGAGGAGLLAGIGAAQAGARTVLYERMKTPARKVAISGGGRCNFSNTLDARKFVRLFGDKHAAFLGNSLRAFSNDDVIALLGRYGVEGQVERNYRLYTKSGRGMDVVEALSGEFQKSGGTLVTQARIISLAQREGVYLLAGNFGGADAIHRARTLVVCTGGLSYPVTGSTGDGYDWARTFGHSVTALRPALVGLTVEENWTRTLQGLAWPDAAVTLWPADNAGRGKPLSSERAEILYTHFGISGPAILDTSNAFVASKLPRAVLLLDYYPEIPREEFDRQLIERFKLHPNRTVARAMDGMMPSRLLEHIEASLGPEGRAAVCRLPKTARLKLLDLLRATRLTVTGTRGMEYGEVTAGGVELGQIDPATLESKCSPGLFFAGEILDLTGRCGGFNLQAAFSTGFLAGTSAARRALQGRAGGAE